MLLHALLVLAFRVRDCQVVAEVLVMLVFLLLMQLLFPRLDVKPRRSRYSRVHFHIKIPFALEPRPFHVGSTALQEVSCELICTSAKTCFASAKCSSDETSRPHQQPLIHLFVSLAARTPSSAISANTDSPNMHKSDTYGIPSKYWNGVLPSGRTVKLESTNPA